MTLHLYDNSRLSDHRRCNRYFYWRHRRHLARDKPNIPANFGSCWSKAMDIVWPAIQKGLTDSQVVELGFDAFVKEWTGTYEYPLLDQMSDDQLRDFRFRHEQTAAGMLPNYVERRRNFIEKVELLSIERPFAVPLQANDPNLFYVGKIDKAIRWEGRVWGLDHKTTSWYRKAGGFAPEWLDSWNPRAQLDGYLHSLKMEYGKDAKGILVDGALVHQNVHDAFVLIPIEKITSNLEEWHWGVMHEVMIIEANDRNLEAHRQMLEQGQGIDFMAAFSKNDNSCIHFMRPCPYLDLCKSVPDPEQMQEIPAGFVEHKWEPFDELQLQKVGLTDDTEG